MSGQVKTGWPPCESSVQPFTTQPVSAAMATARVPIKSGTEIKVVSRVFISPSFSSCAHHWAMQPNISGTARTQLTQIKIPQSLLQSGSRDVNARGRLGRKLRNLAANLAHEPRGVDVNQAEI